MGGFLMFIVEKIVNEYSLINKTFVHALTQNDRGCRGMLNNDHSDQPFALSTLQ